MKDLKLNYFELISPDPIYIQNVGGILSPKLKDISRIGINTYQFYLNIILMDLKTYFTMVNQSEQFESLSDEYKENLSVYDLLISEEENAKLLQNALDFFIAETVIWSKEHNAFLIYKDDNIIGFITKEIYLQICDLICQRNYIKSNLEDDLSKIKSKKALEIMKKLQKGRSEKAKVAKTDNNMELGNIISAVANRSQSLNMINIWDLTVYQVWDCFSRLSNNNIYDIQSMSVAHWGNKDNYFDVSTWFKRIETTN